MNLTILKYIFVSCITIILLILLYSFFNNFSLKKKLDYYKHANIVISDTLSKTDKMNDNLQLQKSILLKNIKKNGKLNDKEIKDINDHIKRYSN